MKPKIFTYLDYRKYLNDLYESCKESNPKFSLRKFARMANSNSPNYLSQINSRKISLTSGSLASLVKNFKFSKKEEDYLLFLVAYHHQLAWL